MLELKDTDSAFWGETLNVGCNFAVLLQLTAQRVHAGGARNLHSECR